MFRNIKIYFWVFIIFYPFSIFSQIKYWIDKDTKYLEKNFNILPSKCSSWLNECTYILDNETVNKLKKANISVKKIHTFRPLENRSKIEENNLNFALEQIHAEAFVKKNLNGKGVKIGIIDGGFLYANTDENLTHFFEKERVKYYKDYITPELAPYDGIASLDDDHGTIVWKNIGGFSTKKQILYGLATEAEFYLARTDHGGYEKKIEEDLLIEALEDMHKMGVRLVNISLGYTNGFIENNNNYKPIDMDGTSNLAKAIDIAFFKKNMVVVVAAGNDGKTGWKVLSTPADAKGALTVGAMKFGIYDKMDYSSIGTPSLNYIKPEISCFASGGTSFSAPIVTGIVAAMMQYDSTLNASDLKKMIIESSTLYPYGNNYLGYGVPNCQVILKKLKKENIVESSFLKKVSTTKKIYKLENSENQTFAIAYHKKEFEVLEREEFHLKPNQKIVVNSREESNQCTLIYGKYIYEIFWDTKE